MKHIKIALIGNPNVGKTSVFNTLTGLNQHVGNYPGVTVGRKVGTFQLDTNTKASILDLPGLYSINHTSKDEEIALQSLVDSTNKDYPDVIVIVAEIENLKRNLLLFTQIKSLEIPTVLAINMADQIEKKGISIDVEQLEKDLQTKIVLLSARENQGFQELKNSILNAIGKSSSAIFDLKSIDQEYYSLLETLYPNQNLYKVWLAQSHVYRFSDISPIISTDSNVKKSEADIKRLQHKETIKRYQFIKEVLTPQTCPTR